MEIINEPKNIEPTVEEEKSMIQHFCEHIYENLGSGRREHIYQMALVHEMKEADKTLNIYTEVTQQIYYKKHPIGFVRYDIVIKNDMGVTTDIIECKTVGKLTPMLKAQAQAYKRDNPTATVHLVNFGLNKVEYEKILY